MEKKRPRGVTVFSWLVIAGSIINLFSLLNMRGVTFPLFAYLYLLISLTSIVVAFYLLQLKNWARTAIIIISVVVGTETLATTPIAVNSVNNYFAENFDRDYAEALKARVGGEALCNIW